MLRVLLARVPARATAAFACLSACSEGQPAVAPDLQVSGDYRLISYNALPVPANVAPLPDRDGNPSGCWLRITAGFISFGSPQLNFRYRYEFEDSCTQELLSATDEQGQYSQTGARLTFTVLTGDGLASFGGEVAGDTVTVLRGNPTLRFAR